MMQATDDHKRDQIEKLYQKSRREFPDVPELTAEEIQKLLEEDAVVLVDVRTEEEQAVSMIEGAITAREFEAEPEKHQGKKIACY